MRTHLLRAALLIGASLLAGCGKESSSSAPPASDTEWTSPVPKLEVSCGEQTCL